jgi:hypothetical protein
MSKHTRGPWAVSVERKARVLIDSYDPESCATIEGGTHHKRIIATVPLCDKDNARLIATAPELYDALVDFVMQEHREGVTTPCGAKASQVLKKARGDL